MARVVRVRSRRRGGRARRPSARCGACTSWPPASERVGEVTLRDRPRALHRARPHDARPARARDVDGPLSGTTGAVLDPIFALRVRVRLRAGPVGDRSRSRRSSPTTRERAFELADRYHDRTRRSARSTSPWTSTQVELRELGSRRLTRRSSRSSRATCSTRAVRRRRAEDRAARNRGSAAAALGDGISGDWPILLATHRRRRRAADAAAAVRGAPLLAPARHAWWTSWS